MPLLAWTFLRPSEGFSDPSMNHATCGFSFPRDQWLFRASDFDSRGLGCLSNAIRRMRYLRKCPKVHARYLITRIVDAARQICISANTTLGSQAFETSEEDVSERGILRTG